MIRFTVLDISLGFYVSLFFSILFDTLQFSSILLNCVLFYSLRFYTLRFYSLPSFSIIFHSLLHKQCRQTSSRRLWQSIMQCPLDLKSCLHWKRNSFSLSRRSVNQRKAVFPHISANLQSVQGFVRSPVSPQNMCEDKLKKLSTQTQTKSVI